jgi:hypothetical protein
MVMLLCLMKKTLWIMMRSNRIPCLSGRCTRG